jgi:hypothetical protein
MGRRELTSPFIFLSGLARKGASSVYLKFCWIRIKLVVRCVTCGIRTEESNPSPLNPLFFVISVIPSCQYLNLTQVTYEKPPDDCSIDSINARINFIGKEI